MLHYQPGATVEFLYEIIANGAYVDPDAPPTFTVFRNYAATEIVPTVTRRAIGQYTASITLSSPWTIGDIGSVQMTGTSRSIYGILQNGWFQVKGGTDAMTVNVTNLPPTIVSA